MLSLIIATTIAASQPVVHQVHVEHQGAAYQLSYRPHVTTQMRTIGMAVGSRPSTERCLWTATIALDREIRRTDNQERLANRVAGAAHHVEGQQAGRCDQARKAVEKQIASKIDAAQERVTALAQADRPAALAQIDAAHAMAMND